MKDFRKIIKNLIVFILLIIITFTIVFKDQDINQVFNIIFNVSLKYVLIGILVMSLYFILEGLNIKNVLNTLGQKVSLFKTFKYSLIGFFFSGITPAASGGQPMEIYCMHKDGIPVSLSTLALLVELISFQIITITSCILGAIINPELLSNGVVYLFITGVSLNFIALCIMLVCLLSEKLARKIVNIFMELLKIFKYKKIEEKKSEIENTLKKYTESAEIIRKHKSIFIKSMIIVFFQVFIYYTIPFWVCKAFGLNNYNIFEIVIIQALLFSSVSSIPLPGAVGISESAFLNLYRNIFGSTLLSSAMILNRFINFYLFVLIGAITTIITSIKLKKL